MSAYRTIDVPVSGGDMRVGLWEPEDGRADAVPAVLLIHGVTASHLSWPFVARRLPGVRVIAPDLRGRGRSNALEGPAGLHAHADDLVAVLDALGVERVVAVGHSMGAFVALVLGDRHPERVSRVVLVDGGLPLDLPAGMSTDDVIAHVLGPTADRLAMRFPTASDYLDFWRAHPAFARDWTPELEAYLAYDLVPADEGPRHAPSLRPATSYATLEEDTVDQNTGTAIVDALTHLRHPTVWLTAERGLLDQLPALYAAERIPGLRAAHPGLEHVAVPDVNHYTIALSERGAAAVASVVEEQLAAARP